MIQIKNLSYSYKDRQALSNVDLTLAKGEIFGLLGPNGSGKTTLLRILATLFRAENGKVFLEGEDLADKVSSARKKLGVVFQSPSLDLKLTVFENLYFHGHFFGLSGSTLRKRCREILERFGLKDRERDLCEKLSGGLKRRVELAKSMLGEPRVMILDEPSTGLDPGARRDLWAQLKNLNEREGITIVVATHLMEEGEYCTRLAVMNEGRIAAVGTPDDLKAEVGKEVLVIRASGIMDLAVEIEKRFKVKSNVVDGTLQVEHDQSHRFVPELVESFPGRIESVMVRRPTLEDVYAHKTGHEFWRGEKVKS